MNWPNTETAQQAFAQDNVSAVLGNGHPKRACRILAIVVRSEMRTGMYGTSSSPVER